MNRPLPALLTCQSYFSEGRSTVGPRRLVRLAKERGYSAVGLTDWCSVAGAVELCEAAGEAQLSAVIGVTLPVLFSCAAQIERKSTRCSPWCCWQRTGRATRCCAN